MGQYDAINYYLHINECTCKNIAQLEFFSL